MKTITRFLAPSQVNKVGNPAVEFRFDLKHEAVNFIPPELKLTIDRTISNKI